MTYFLMSLTFQNSYSQSAQAEEIPLSDSAFIRLRYDENGNMKSLDTSLVTFVSADGTQRVTLIGAIHIAERRYYKKLNEIFTNYDAVLFEMVSDGDPRPVSSRDAGGFISSLQRLGGTLMDLDYQIGSINYHAENFVHADMTGMEFNAAKRRRGDGFLVWFLRSYGYALAVSADDNTSDSDSESLNSDLEILKLLFLPKKSRTFRRLNAPGMVNLKSTTIPVEGRDGSTLLRDRNTKALKVLREQLDSGKKNVAIFYGAAHLPDFSHRLQTDFGMKPEKITWVPCWKLD
ncbi:MAG: hypothetical protein Q4C70_04210 [Planctomycetia bacterium]|nr:hypothetical protein [Planctomycetia bacterium]